MLNIVPAATPRDIEDVRVLFCEYAGLVAEALCFQTFDHELAALPAEYVPPGGALLIARDADAAAGCVALRRLDAGRALFRAQAFLIFSSKAVVER